MTIGLFVATFVAGINLGLVIPDAIAILRNRRAKRRV